MRWLPQPSPHGHVAGLHSICEIRLRHCGPQPLAAAQPHWSSSLCRAERGRALSGSTNTLPRNFTYGGGLASVAAEAAALTCPPSCSELPAAAAASRRCRTYALASSMASSYSCCMRLASRRWRRVLRLPRPFVRARRGPSQPTDWRRPHSRPRRRCAHERTAWRSHYCARSRRGPQTATCLTAVPTGARWWRRTAPPRSLAAAVGTLR